MSHAIVGIACEIRHFVKRIRNLCMGTTWFKVYSVDDMCDEVELQIHLLNRLKTSRRNKSLFVEGIFGSIWAMPLHSQRAPHWKTKLNTYYTK